MRNDDNQLHDDADRRLWQRFRQATNSPDTQKPGDLDPNDLAAYIDGTAPPALVESIEQRLASDGQLLETVIELRQIRDSADSTNDSAVPQAVTAMAKGLVSQAAASRRDETRTILYRINWSRLQWAAAAVFILTAGWGGYRTGLNAYTTNSLDDIDAPALVFDLDGEFDEPSVALVDLATGGEQ